MCTHFAQKKKKMVLGVQFGNLSFLYMSILTTKVTFLLLIVILLIHQTLPLRENVLAVPSSSVPPASAHISSPVSVLYQWYSTSGFSIVSSLTSWRSLRRDPALFISVALVLQKDTPQASSKRTWNE